ncbi:MAG: hypothetical protein ACK4Y6_04580 [Bacteroidota bacterium]|jgi:hypothetical protein
MRLPTAAAALLFIFTYLNTHAQYTIQLFDTLTYTYTGDASLRKISFRGISSPDESVMWASGSKGTVARTTNGGKQVTLNQLKGYESSDFRDIHAWDDKHAVVMSSGTPALILTTHDGGQTWNESFRQNDSAWFLDAIDFWDSKNGMAIADPIHSRFMILRTSDGGKTWKLMDTAVAPIAHAGESLFAASGTALRCLGKNTFAFVTGGSVARLIVYAGNAFTETLLNVKQGKTSCGANSFVPCGNDSFMVVGGDYSDSTASTGNSCMVTIKASDVKVEPTHLSSLLNYYASAVDEIRNSKSGKVYIATGTNGTYMYTNTWNKINPIPFHTLTVSKRGRILYVAGGAGKLGRIHY